MSEANSHVLGVNTTTMFYQLESSEELYFPRARFCREDASCAAERCYPGCDFSSQTACSQGVQTQVPGGCDCGQDRWSLWCSSPVPSYTSLSFNDETWSEPFTATPTSPSYHRFYSPGQCEGFQVELQVYSGAVHMFISSEDPFPSSPLGTVRNNYQYTSLNTLFVSDFFAETEDTAGVTVNTAVMLESEWNYNICPGSVYFDHGTFAVSVVPVTLTANYSIRVLATASTATTLASPITPATGQVIVLPGPGVSQPIVSPAGLLADITTFEYTIEGCQTLLIQLEQRNFSGVLLYAVSTTNSVQLAIQLNSLFLLAQESSRPLGFCPPTGQSSWTFYITVVALFRSAVPSEYILTVVTVDSLDPSARSLVPLTTPQTETAALMLRGIASVVCNTSSSTSTPSTTTTTFGCLPGSDLFFDSTCSAFLPRVATDFFGIGRPIPPVFRSFDSERFDVLFFDDPPIGQAAFSFQLFFEVLNSYKRVVPIADVSQDSFSEQCSFVFPNFSPVVTASGAILADAPLPLSAVPANSSNACDSASWTELSGLLRSLALVVFDNASLERETYAAKYLYDISTLSRTWTDCQARLETLLNSTQERIFLAQTTLCLNDPLDACCSSSVGWQQCCHDRDFHIITSVFSTVDDDKVASSCLSPTCTSGLLDEYLNTIIAVRNRNVCSPILPDFASQQQINFDFYTACFTELFTPRECTANADCLVHFACDPARALCYPESVDQLRLDFWQCLADNVTANFLDDLTAVLIRNTDYTPSTPLVDLFEALLVTDDCLSSVSMATPFSLQANPISEANPACPVCQAECPNTLCTASLQCSSSKLRTGLCAYDFTLSRPAGFYDSCTSTRRCNWDATIEDEGECLTPSSADQAPGFFCGWCADNNTECFEVRGPTSAAECAALTLCALPSGAVRADLTAAECEALQACTEDCSGCNVDGATCAEAGNCFSTELSTFQQRLQPSATGYCVFAMQPFNQPDCASNLTRLQWTPAAVGCIAYSRCSATGCHSAFADQSSCESAGGSWNALGTDQVTCTGYVGCVEDKLYPLFSPKDSAECRFCVGHVLPVNTWTPGQWLPAVAYPLSWLPRRLVSPYHWGKSIDFARLDGYLREAELHFLAQPLAADLQCRYLVRQTLTDHLICSCFGNNNNNDDDSSSNCFERDVELQVVLQMCKSSAFYYIAPPITVTSLESSFTANDPSTTCCSITIEGLNIHSWTTRSGPPISTFQRVLHTSATSEYSFVVNKNRAVIGQAVGNGAQISFPDGVCPQSFYLCLDQTPDATDAADLTSYPVLDFGKPFAGDSTKLTPIGASIILTETGEFCSVIRNLERTQIFVPIIRKQNYNHDTVEYETPGERATLYIVATTYLAPALLSLGEIVYIVWVSHAFSLRESTNLMFVFFAVLACVRCIYFYLSASLVFATSTTVVEYVLVELPTFMYLAAGLLLTWNFSFLLLRRSYPTVSRLYWPSFIIAMTMLVLFFVGIILALQFAVISQNTTSTDSSNICSSIVPAPASQAPVNAKIIRLVYQSVVAALAFSIFVGLGTAGFVVYRDSKAQGYGAQTMLRLVVIASLALLLDTLAFITYYAIASPTPYFTIVLIFTEVIPISLLIVLLHKPPPKAETRRTRRSARA